MNENTNINISGSGSISSGEYNKVAVSGSGRLLGLVRCVSFTTSGSSKGENIECAEDLRISGSASFSGDIKSERVHVSGAFSSDGDVTAGDSIICAGSASCGGNVKCSELSISGLMNVTGDIESETVKVGGALNCKGFLNAEEIVIGFSKSGMNIGGIGCGKIIVAPQRMNKLFTKLRVPSKSVSVLTSIEGDEIDLENVRCPRVTGRTVLIKDDCDIDLVQYLETVEISPRAKVGKIEKI